MEEDAKVSPTQRTCRELNKIMDSIYPNLKFEMEHCEMFDGKLPTLDFQMYVLNNLVNYEFFSKPMANKNVICKRSALSENVKIASLNH